MRGLFISFLCLLLTDGITQSFISHLSKEPCELQIFKVGKNERKSRIIRSDENNVVLSFHEGFSDTVQVYVGGSLHFKQFVRSDTLGRGYACAATEINFSKLRNRKTKVHILIPKLAVYTNFRIGRKYALIKIHRIASVWYVIQTNYVPEYQ
jgi:hypothetical protein